MKDAQVTDIAKALGHPLRLELLRALRDRRVISPVEFSKEKGERLGNVSYHVRALFDLGVIAEAGMIPRRGAMEHRYSLTGEERRRRAGCARPADRDLGGCNQT